MTVGGARAADARPRPPAPDVRALARPAAKKSSWSPGRRRSGSRPCGRAPAQHLQHSAPGNEARGAPTAPARDPPPPHQSPRARPRRRRRTCPPGCEGCGEVARHCAQPTTADRQLQCTASMSSARVSARGAAQRTRAPGTNAPHTPCRGCLGRWEEGRLSSRAYQAARGTKCLAKSPTCFLVWV